MKETLLACDQLKEKNNLLSQIFYNLQLGNYAIAGIATSTLIEYVLAMDVDINSVKLKHIIDEFKNETENIDISYDGIQFLFGLDGFLENYSANTNGFGKDKELDYPNRHWIAHGRMHKDLTKPEAYQLICALYAIVKVINTKNLWEADNFYPYR
ncbi:hypothetical protein [Butyrivibrio sp. INlla14]|uniref:hypothetical protein n=1 Tax=Butyrivibrio sp. INlla14 TaxID=1520808 RepID=UPI00115FC614|nr:hypothetical protein [Butyrivibrio sp. INlla14]